MTGIEPIFERLGLQQYLDSFLDEGFDTWETVLDITESDLDALNVKLGHRRKLQREIAHARGVNTEHFAPPVVSQPTSEGKQSAEADAKSSSHSDGKSIATNGSKRKYRRHPKPDENAPERPPSAYVIFSNKVREELRPHRLSFTDIAKTVGEKWQLLTPEEREPYETQAVTSKEYYNAAMTKYKRTTNYRNYAHYLTEFKARNPSTHPQTKSIEGKRPRLEHQGSSASNESVSSKAAMTSYEHTRNDSSGALGYSPSNSSLNSPTSNMAWPLVSHSSVESPQSSHPGTPLSSHHRSPMVGPSTSQGPRAIELSRTQPLPRILPVEHMDLAMSQSSLTPLATDLHSSQHQNPRRSTGAASSFLRHDTSKSSISSIFSSTSLGSSGITPITPHEETRPLRALPPPPLAATHQYPDDRRQSFVPLAPKSSPSYSSITNITHVQAPEYSQTIDGLSIGEIAPSSELPYKRPYSSSHHRAGDEGPSHDLDRYTISYRHNSPYTQQAETGYPSQSTALSERQDPLSVLALAGSMVGRERNDGNGST